MQKQTKEVEIGGHKFFINRLPATAALDLLSELLQGVGPAMGALAEKVNLKELMSAKAVGKPMSEALAALELNGFSDVVRKFVTALGRKELRSIASQALAATVCATQGGKRVWEGQAPLVDALNLTARETLELIWTALRWNFEDFFPGPSASDSRHQVEGPNSKG